MRINAKHRKQLNKKLWAVLKPVYFDDIPLQNIFDTLKEEGIIVIQEDGEPWSGFLLGEDSFANFALKFNDKILEHFLCLSWHRMSSGRIEVCGYIS